MNSANFQLRLNTVMDIGDVQGNISNIQNYLNKLKVPDSIRKEFSAAFESAQKEAQKIQDILGKKNPSKGDVSGLEKSFQSLDKYINKIGSSMDKLSGKNLFKGMKIETPEIKQTMEQIQALQNQLKQEISSASIQEVTKAIQNMSTVSKSVSLERFKEAFKAGDIQTARQELNNLTANLKQFKDAGKIDTYSNGLKVLESTLKGLDTSKVQQLSDETQNLHTKLQSLTDAEFKKLMQGAQNAGTSIKNLGNEVNRYGQSVVAAKSKQQEFNNEIGQIKDRIKHFFGLANSVYLLRRALRDAFNEMKQLDSVMTETAVVTPFTVGDMWDKLPEYTENANKLGVSIKSAYEAATLYYQQGLKTNEVIAVSNETLKMARIAGMDASEATDRERHAA